MQLMLLLQNLRLFVFLFGALVFFSMSWLYFDALVVRKQWSVFARAFGAFLLGCSFLGSSVMAPQIMWVVEGIKIIGFLILIIGVWGEPLSKRPEEDKKKEEASLASYIPLGLGLGKTLSIFAIPILPGFVALGYLWRSSVGLERHLKSMAYGMYVLSFAEILDLRRLFLTTENIQLFEFTRDFGAFWILHLVVLAVGLLMISSWVFGYLLRRFETQITLFMSMLVIGVFAVSTSVFTFIMAGRMEKSILRETVSGTRMVLNDLNTQSLQILGLVEDKVRKVEVIEAVELINKEALASVAKKTPNNFEFYNLNGENIISNESIASTSIFKLAKVGKFANGFEVTGIGSGKKIFVLGGGPVKKDDKVVGVVILREELNLAILAQLADSINQDIRLFVDGEVVVASSVPEFTEISSSLGLKTKISDLGEKTKIVSGFRLGGVSYVSSFDSLKSPEGVRVAVLETSIPMATLWKSIESALVSTFGAGVIILLLVEIPAILMARYLTRQLK